MKFNMFIIMMWVIMIMGVNCFLSFEVQEQNKQIMAKVEHLEAVMLCNPIDLTGEK